MPQQSDMPDIKARELRDLSALADGTLAPERRDEVTARIAASPELTALYERERHVVGIVHDANANVRAPAGLRARIDAQRPKRSVAARRRVGYGGALAAALAAVVLALGYTVVAPPGANGPAGQVTVRPGVPLRPLTLHGRLVVTWRRDNHTCVLSGNGVGAAELEKLAAWEGPEASA